MIHAWAHGVVRGDAYRGGAGGTLLSLERSTYTSPARGDYIHRGVAMVMVVIHTLLSQERTTYTSPAREDYIHGGVAMVMGGDTYTSLAREDYIHFSRKGGLHTWRRGNGDEW